MSDNYEDVRSEGQALKERFIDLEVRHQAMLARDEMRRQNSGFPANTSSSTQHPATTPVDEFDWTREEELHYLSLYSQQYRDEIASWFSDLDEIFDDLAQLPDPAGFRSAAGELTSTLTLLAGPSAHTDFSDGGHVYSPHPAYEQLQSIPTYLVDWNGIAADAFKSNFIPPLERVVHHEFEAVVSLRSALLAEEAMWKEGRIDVSNLIDEANSALDDYEGGKDAADAVLALSIIGAVVAVAAVPFTGGTSAALYWTMAGSALAVTGAVVGHPNEPKKELDIKGDSPAEICQSMRGAVVDMKLQWIDTEGFIRDHLRILSDQMAGYTQPAGTDPEDISPRPRHPDYGYYGGSDHSYSEATVHEFMLPRPALADSTRGNVTDDDHMGTPEV